jgi:hypothetical protein
MDNLLRDDVNVGVWRFVVASVLTVTAVFATLATTQEAKAATLSSWQTLDSTGQEFLQATESTTSNAKAVIWSRGTNENPALRLGYSTDGISWVTSDVPTISGQKPVARYDDRTVQIKISPVTGSVMVLWASQGTSWLLHSAIFNGTSWSSPTNLVSGAFPSGSLKLVVSPTTGRFTALFVSNNTLRITTTTDSTGLAWADAQFSANGRTSVYSPNLVVDASGTVTAIWGDQKYAVPYEDYIVAASSVDGQTWQTPVRITRIYPWYNGNAIQAAVSPSGTIVVIQETNINADGSQGGNRIDITTFSKTLSPSTTSTRVGTNDSSPLSSKISVGADGTFAIGYRYTNTSYTNLSYAVITSANGITWSAESDPFKNTTFGQVLSVSFDLAISPAGQVFISGNRISNKRSIIMSALPGQGWVTEVDYVASVEERFILSLNSMSYQLSIFSTTLNTESNRLLKASTISLAAIVPSQARVSVAIGGSVSMSVTASQLVSPITYSVSPALPASLTLNSSTGTITGTVNAIQALTNYTITGTPASGSNASTTVAIEVLAAGPQNLIATPASGQVSVAFTPGDNGGAAITNYKYSVNNGDTWTTRSPVSTASPLVITGLTNGTTYPIKLKAVTASGDSAESVAISSTPAVAPSAPTLTSVTAGNARVTASFTAGANGGSAILNYEYSLDGGETWTPRSPASVTGSFDITGLTNGTSYGVKLRAVTAVGSGVASNAISATPVTVAFAPNELAGSPLNERITLYWTAPVDPLGAAISGYQIQMSITTRNGSYANVSTGTCSSAAPTSVATSCTITGLTNGSTYFFKVAALNSVGASQYSIATSGVVPRTIPDAPTLTGLQVGNRSLDVAFTFGGNGGNGISAFEYSIDSGVNWVESIATVDSTSFTILGLTNGTSYSVLLRAVNDAGNSLESSALTATPVTTASAPTNIAVTYGYESATITFTNGDDGGSPITDYEYSIDGGVNWTVHDQGPISASITISSLSSGVSHSLLLRSITAQGAGEASTGNAIMVPIPAVTLQTAAIVAGSISNIEGFGFVPLSDIRIEIHSTPFVLGTVQADVGGNFSTNIAIPAVFSTGSHLLVFVYILSGVQADSIPITISAPVVEDIPVVSPSPSPSENSSSDLAGLPLPELSDEVDTSSDLAGLPLPELSDEVDTSSDLAGLPLPELSDEVDTSSDLAGSPPIEVVGEKAETVDTSSFGERRWGPLVVVLFLLACLLACLVAFFAIRTRSDKHRK